MKHVRTDKVEELTRAKHELNKAQRTFKNLEYEIFKDPDALMELIEIGVIRVDYTNLLRRVEL